MENLYDSSYKSATGTSVLSMVMRKVYGRMFLALVVTALTSLYVASSPAILSVVLGNRAAFLFLQPDDPGGQFGFRRRKLVVDSHFSFSFVLIR